MRGSSPRLLSLFCIGMLAACSGAALPAGEPAPYDPDRADCLWYSSLDDLLFAGTGRHFFLDATQVAERKAMLDPCTQYASSMRQGRASEK